MHSLCIFQVANLCDGARLLIEHFDLFQGQSQIIKLKTKSPHTNQARSKYWLLNCSLLSVCIFNKEKALLLSFGYSPSLSPFPVSCLQLSTTNLFYIKRRRFFIQH